MSEEIKNNELKDEELEQVTGGRGGDTFGDNTPLTVLNEELKDASSTAIYVSGGGNLA